MFSYLQQSARRGALLSLTLAFAVVLAACSGGGTDGDNAGGVTVTVTDGVAEIGADDIAFDATTITAPADEPFTVAFTNMEGVPHNFSVYAAEGGDLLAEGTIINEGETDEVAVEGLAAGEYFFVCDLHAGEMQGTLIVGR